MNELYIKKCPICGSDLIQTTCFSVVPPHAEYRCSNPRCIYVLNAFYNNGNFDEVTFQDNINDSKEFYCKHAYPQLGWECPKCGAVMAPSEKVCVNCRGNITIT